MAVGTNDWPNPLIAGFNPDPSIVLVDGVYTLVTSTFEYLPGIPVYRSTDLVTWTQIGNVITRSDQLDLTEIPTPGGVWAPTIRHRGGRYYVIVSVMFPGRCLVYTAADPAGPWSDGVRITGIDGIDPDLAWDDDGTAFVTFAILGGGIMQCTVDLEGGRIIEGPRPLWSGTGLHAPEGPHLYHRGDDWYLLISEGGTERGHALSVARGASPAGPFDPNPANPFFSARSTALPIQNTGHADLVSTPDGGTAAVFLGVRPLGFTRAFSPLGRETFITPVEWVDGWPVAEVPSPNAAQSGGPVTFDFGAADALGDPGWIAVRRHPAQIAHLDPTAGTLVIEGEGTDLSNPRTPFIGRRQTNLTARVSAQVDASAGVGGLAARHSEHHWFAIEAQALGSGRTRVTAIAALASVRQTWTGDFNGEHITLRIESDALGSDVAESGPVRVGGDRIRLLAASGADEVLLAELDGRYWSFETTESFTGRVVGLYAVSGVMRFADFTYDGVG